MIDAFKIGVHIGMTSNGTMVLAELMRGLLGLDKAAVSTAAKMGTLRRAALGAIGVFAGFEAIKGIWHLVEHSQALNRELERTKQLGGEFAKNLPETRRQAFATATAVPTISPSESVRMMRELGTVVGQPEDAGKIIGAAAKIAHAVSNFTGEKEEDLIKNLIKVADIRAKIFSMGLDGKEHVDMAKLMGELESAGKGLILGGNYLKSGDLLQFIKQAGVPVKGQTAEAVYAAGVEMAISQGAARTGTAETSLYQQLVGGTMTKKTATNMTNAGMLSPNDWTSGRSGGVTVKPSGLQKFAGVETDPIGWLTGEGHKYIEKYAKQNAVSEIAAVFQLFGRQTTQRLVAEAISAAPQFARAREMYGNIPGLEGQYAELQKNNLATNIQDVSKAWEGFIEALGDAGVPAAIVILHNLTDGLHVLMNAVEAHPDAAKNILEVAAGLSALVALSGGLAVLGAALGPLAAGLRLLMGLAPAAAAVPVASAVPGAVGAVAGAASGVGAGAGAVAAGAAGTGTAGSLAAGVAEISLGGAALMGAGALAGAGGLIYLMSQVTPDSFKAAEHQLDDLAKQRRKQPAAPGLGEGLDENGMPVRSDVQVRPPVSEQPIQLHGDITLDGAKMGAWVAGKLTDGMGRPSGGMTQFDFRVSPWAAGVGAVG